MDETDAFIGGTLSQLQMNIDLEHHPPYKPNTEDILKPSLRSKVLERRRNRLLNYNVGFSGSGLGFMQDDESWLINIMEERLLRYREPNNQTSIEESLNGNHIYQTQKDDGESSSSRAVVTVTRGAAVEERDSTISDTETMRLVKRLNDRFHTGSSTLNTSIINMIYADSCFPLDSDRDNGLIKSQPFDIEDLNEFDKNRISGIDNNDHEDSGRNFNNSSDCNDNGCIRFWKNLWANNTNCLCTRVISENEDDA